VEGRLNRWGKKKGRTEVRPKFREEKPEGLAMLSGRPGVAPHDEFRAENVNKWLTSRFFWGRWLFFLSGGGILLPLVPSAAKLHRMTTPQHRRLSDKILSAFDQACQQHELDVAELLVKALELTLTRAGGKGNVDKRHELGPVVEAYEKLQRLRKDVG
jgi:hypothetical protein